MTPLSLSKKLTDSLELTAQSKILEPSFGEGSFLIAIIDNLLEKGKGTRQKKLERIFTEQLHGVELDNDLYETAITRLEDMYGPLPSGHHLGHNDFFRELYRASSFDFVIGNPPFGGTFNAEDEDRLDKQYGKWGKYKLKKETYSFFMARSLDLLKQGGTLRFISSDTFMTISTMKGLRHRLMDQCSSDVEPLTKFSPETSYPMVVLTAVKGDVKDYVIVDGAEVSFEHIALTDNFSWSINEKLVKYFRGPKLSDYVICTSGMTVGKNEYFVRELAKDGSFYEPYNFTFYTRTITLIDELEKARLGKISPAKQMSIKEQESRGETYRAVMITKKPKPTKLHYPHADYALYNKANNAIVYAKPRHIIYWKNNGDAVITYKKTGNWYLRGVAAKKFFGREGLTWQLISSRINMKYLPEGYVLDSGAPSAFLRDGIDKNELLFILGWTLTDLATTILKTAINHTKNIQGKDIERLPYPWWVDNNKKYEAITVVQKLVEKAKKGSVIERNDKSILYLNELFSLQNDKLVLGSRRQASDKPLTFNFE